MQKRKEKSTDINLTSVIGSRNRKHQINTGELIIIQTKKAIANKG